MIHAMKLVPCEETFSLYYYISVHQPKCILEIVFFLFALFYFIFFAAVYPLSEEGYQVVEATF